MSVAYVKSNLGLRCLILEDLKMMCHDLTLIASCKCLKGLLRSKRTGLLIQPNRAHRIHTFFYVRILKLYALVMDFTSFSSLRCIYFCLDFLHSRLKAKSPKNHNCMRLLASIFLYYPHRNQF